ncbi:MAG: hypothetical protein LQ338_001715 [Usnochroma carphineum]|nr:MAG: hypothetical protein LQ338_001715 [Usnochroma carphineum]
MSRSGTNTSSPDANGKLGAFAGLNGMLMQAVEGGNFKTGLTPAGMGTPGGEGVSPLPSHLGGAGEGAGSSMGNGSILGKQRVRDQEEERKMRLETIVRLLGERWGYVSREGVERCARRVGLECLWEDEVPGAEGRTLSIAGNSVLVDVLFLGKGDEVGSVHLGFPEREDGEWSRSAGEGAEVLKRDLKGEEGRWGYVGLEPFVGNLERLARLDRLGIGSVNCFDAVEGVGGALRKVWELEIKKRREEKREARDEEIEVDVMCKDSGKPTMHIGGRLGLALQYWTEGRYLGGRKRKADEMDSDDFLGKDVPIEEPTTWSATIECEASSADLYPSIRISSDWVRQATDNPTTDQQQQQDPFRTDNDSPYTWQDPPLTFISSEPSASDAMNLDTDGDPLLPQPKAPDVRFVARLNPPVLVPLQTALNIYESVGAPLPQESIHSTTFDSLLFNRNSDRTPFPPSSSTERAVVVERELYTPRENGSGERKRKKHQYTLFTDPPHQVYARYIEDIPFSHPRQLVALLPTLRQWAYVGSMLRRCFVAPASDSSVVDSPTTNDDIDAEEEDDRFGPEVETEEGLADFLNGNNTTSSSSTTTRARAVDISLALCGTAAPRVGVTFLRGEGIADVGFCVGENAVVGSVEVRLGDGGDSEESGRDEEREKRRREKVKRVVEVGEDLGVLVEWMG